MKNSRKPGKLAEIEIFVHWSFETLPAWVALSHLAAGSGPASAAFGVCFLLDVFSCWLLPELP